jgi:alpha-D-xyloside xylohydrolase
MNSTFKNSFNFGREGRFDFGIDTLGFNGRMDYFFIAGGNPKAVLKHYIELTGKPRLPGKAMFGLALSDKGHDHTSPTPSDETWWKGKIDAHRAAGYPLDHVVNDNRWRAGGGQRCESYFDWDKERYPDPAEYAAWLKTKGLVATLDFNRCIARFSDGWQAAFNLPDVGKIDFKDSAPDLTNPAFRDWFWNTFYKKSFNPALRFPGDAMWIDEFDEQGVAPEKMILANGLSSTEMRNNWFMLIAKSLVQQGWDKSDVNKRPYVWVRGMTAGAQRYATLWSGDIKADFPEMKLQIRGMQLAGLSGFPFWGHDAGGFSDGKNKGGPNADVYKKWSMAFGAFAPIWKPHGVGPSRWPLDRTEAEQKVAHQFAQQRYELMPYLYSAAHEAASSGVPMARAMLLEYPSNKEAWQYDLQYMWGPDLLVAPFTSTDQQQDVWLPPGKWQNYWQPGMLLDGGRVITLTPDANEIGVFVKAGAMVSKYQFAQSTAFENKSVLVLDVYRGADGQAELLEDDDQTEAFRKKGELMKTRMTYRDAGTVVRIDGAQGGYAGAPTQRAYQLRLHGAVSGACFTVNGAPAKVAADAQLTVIDVPASDIRRGTVIAACRP